MADISEIVERFYAAFTAGDVDGALALCSADAQWQAGTPYRRWSGSQPIREYLTMILPESVAEGNTVESWQSEVFDELVVAKVRTTHGSGLMVFRVSDGKLTDIWVVDSKGRDSVRGF